MKHLPHLMIFAVLATGCGAKVNDGDKFASAVTSSAIAVDDQTQEVMDSLVDDLDEGAGESFPQGQELTYEPIDPLIIQQSFNSPLPNFTSTTEETPELCTRAVKQPCVGVTQEQEYDYCQVRLSQLTGMVTLSYSSEFNCEESSQAGRIVLSQVGDSVTRDISAQRIGPTGTITTVSGSATFERLESGFLINKDKFRIKTKDGKEKFNYHLEATDLEVNKLPRIGRRIHNGNITVTHNLAGFTGSHTFNEVRWETSCCYPSSGSIDVELTGSRERSETLTFSEVCGLVVASDEEGNEREIKLRNCRM